MADFRVSFDFGVSFRRNSRGIAAIASRHLTKLRATVPDRIPPWHTPAVACLGSVSFLRATIARRLADAYTVSRMAHPLRSLRPTAEARAFC
jgi:hypothetical protein